MKCAECGVSFNDGVQCSTFKKHLDFKCANISEAGYKKLGADRKAIWKCAHCRGQVSSPAPADKMSPVLDTILSELREVKLQLASLPTLLEDVKLIKQEISELKTSMEFNSAKLDEHSIKISDLERKMTDFQNLRSSFDASLSDVATLRKDLAAKEQWARLNSVEVKGVPVKSGENLFTVTEALTKAVGYGFPKTQINYISRVPFIAAARSKKILTAADIGFEGNSQRIFVNDHLTPDSKNLLTKTKSHAKEKGYNYVWVKFCKIHVRKNDTSRVFIVTCERDLNKIA
ncbi:hypothetical protein ABMA28_015222 [Loxostege sticticalis]|uniref:FP protein C-terminal domain-containing protein n=1 Tax=Loxostege sticticalis TaxID=481309 RepID=A0ABD0TES0_LOXSC